MLPVGNRPIVDYVVRDCIKAGIQEIYFVVNKGSTQLQQYYSDNERLNQFLEYNRKQDLMELTRPPHNVVFHYIEQDSNGKYGTAVPVSLVAPLLKKEESVLVVGGDEFVYNSDGSSELARLIARTPNGTNGMLTTTVNPAEVGRYGVIDFNEDTGLFAGIVDYPHPDQAPSNQITITKYLLNYEIIMRVYNYCQLDVSGEYYLTSVLTQAAKEQTPVTVVPIAGEYLDCGNVHGWLHANNLIVERTA